MKISLLYEDSEMDISIKGRIDEGRLKEFSDILDHAVLKKSDVTYSQNERCLILKLRRNEYEKKKKRFLWFRVWIASKYPEKDCILTIRDVESCEIKDADISKTQEELVVIGGIIFDNNQIYIGSFCEHDYSYGITLEIERINVNLSDI